jgi:hypothetical protein
VRLCVAKENLGSTIPHAELHLNLEVWSFERQSRP